MSARPEQPEPFIRGAAYPAAGGIPYPRANPTDTARLPADVWSAAAVPVGIRLELVGDAEAIDIAYRTTSGNLGYRGDGAGIAFSVWRGGRRVCDEEAVLGDGLIRLALGSTNPDAPAIIYLPEGMQPLILSLTAVAGEIAPAPPLPRWVAYGDWTTQGWIASGPARGWAAITARKAGLNLVNLGYAGAGRGEIVSAEHIAGLGAEVISIAYGESCWTRIPHTAGMVAEGLLAFIDVVRQGHPQTPLVVASPVIRPDAEEVPNKLDTTLSDIRHAMESVTRDRIVAGDDALSLVAGERIIDASHLADGIHPGDEGHKRIAAAMTRALTSAMDPAARSSVSSASSGPTDGPPDGPGRGRRMRTPDRSARDERDERDERERQRAERQQAERRQAERVERQRAEWAERQRAEWAEQAGWTRVAQDEWADAEPDGSGQDERGEAGWGEAGWADAEPDGFELAERAGWADAEPDGSGQDEWTEAGWADAEPDGSELAEWAEQAEWEPDESGRDQRSEQGQWAEQAQWAGRDEPGEAEWIGQDAPDDREDREDRDDRDDREDREERDDWEWSGGTSGDESGPGDDGDSRADGGPVEPGSSGTRRPGKTKSTVP